jgi:hypothetical protein
VLASIVQLLRVIVFTGDIRGGFRLPPFKAVELQEGLSVSLVRTDNNPRLGEKVTFLEESDWFIGILARTGQDFTTLQSEPFSQFHHEPFQIFFLPAQDEVVHMRANLID